MPAPEFAEFPPSLISSAVESLAEGVVLLDAEGVLQYVNRAFAEGVGLPARELVGRCFDDPIFIMRRLDGTRVEPADRPFRHVIATGEPVLGLEFELENVRGERVRVILNVVPVRQEDRMLGVVATFLDITRRAHAEDALRESEGRLAAFFDQVRYGLVIFDPKGDVVLYNPAMEAITGHSYEEIRQKGWSEAAYPDPEERAHAIEMAGKSIRGEVSYNEEPYTRADGERIWLSYAVSPVRLEGGDYVASIIIDVTERKKAEERVHFQSSLLDQAHNAVVAADINANVTYMNDAAEELLGWDAQAAIGRPVEEVVVSPGVDREHLLRRLLEAESWEGESVIRRKSGETVPVMLSLALLRDAKGDPEGVVGVASDIRDMKAAQRQLEEKDRAIRQAYVDVVSAVTGGKLVLVTNEEMDEILGEELPVKDGIRFDTLSDSRRRVQEAMEREGITADPREAIIAYGEAATNALKHAGGGRYGVYRRDRVLQVLVSDDGRGIDFRTLPRATLLPGFSTGQTLGVGFTVMLEISDRLLLTTQPGCTRVLLEFAK